MSRNRYLPRNEYDVIVRAERQFRKGNISLFDLMNIRAIYYDDKEV
jgi:hypothetical protein